MKYNKSLFESIKESLNKKERSTDSAFKDFLKLEKNNTYIVRLIPNVSDFEKTFFHYYSHTFTSRTDQTMVNVFCPNTYGERCPIDEYRSKIWKTGDEAKREEIRPLKRNENWLVNVYVIKDPTNPENQGEIKTLRYGKQLHKIIDEAINGEESDEFGSRIFDLSGEGCNLKIKVDENDGGYATYVASKFMSKSEIADLEEPDDLYDKVREFDGIFIQQSYDDITSILNKHWLSIESNDSKNSNKLEDDDDVTPITIPKKSEESVDEMAKVDKDLDDLLKDL